jgi:hypothetical protein
MNDMIVADTPEKINAFRLLALKGALKLETLGMKGKVNAYKTIKNEFGLKGDKKKVYDLFVQHLKDEGILV